MSIISLIIVIISVIITNVVMISLHHQVDVRMHAYEHVEGSLHGGSKRSRWRSNEKVWFFVDEEEMRELKCWFFVDEAAMERRGGRKVSKKCGFL